MDLIFGRSFSRSYNLLTASGSGWSTQASRSLQISEAGYIYIWVSNESENTRVWFDDLKIAHSTGFVAQAIDYGVWGDVIREQKADPTAFYRYGYQ